MNIPNHHQTVMPYLMLTGAAHFIDFAIKVFDAQLLNKRMHVNGTIMHAEIQIGGCTIMLSEATEQWKPQFANLFIYVDNADTRYNKAISNGAKEVMELSNQDYGRTCGVTDPFGNTWWITSINNQ
ncbi:MAG: VOC family protein [Bacteroidota bacterium]